MDVQNSVPKSCQENTENLENWVPEAHRILVGTHQTTARVQARLVMKDQSEYTN